MKKMNKIKLSKANKTLLALTLVSCCMISATIAKYISTISDSDTARVALFQVDTNIDDEQEFDLFGTLYDSDGTLETDVLSLQNDKVIAPGTKGYFDIDIENNSEVSVAYNLNFTWKKTDLKIPIEFSVDEKTWHTTTLRGLNVDGELRVSDEPVTETVRVYWRWRFERGTITQIPYDETDTALGLDGTAETTVLVKGTFTQLD